MESGSKHTIYGFDNFRLDCNKLMLYCDDEPIALPPKVIKTLVVLVENRGSILSKDELMESVWEDAVVEEANLSQNLYLLRKTLGSKPDGVPYIETLRRRGYRFTSEAVSLETVPPKPVEQSVTPSTPVTERYTVERRGNVVALVDWKEAEETSAAIEKTSELLESPNEEPRRQRNSSSMRLFAGIAALLAVAALGVGFWLSSPKAAQVVEENQAALEFVALTNGEEVNDATISRDGKYFTYHESDGEFSRMLVQQTGQAKAVEILPKAKRVIAGKTFSPDSQYIYYLGAEPGADHNSIYRVPTLGGVRTKVVEHASSHVTFSPDGKFIAFQRVDSLRNSSLVAAESDGTGERTLLTRNAVQYIAPNPAWSPDGGVVAFAQVDNRAGVKPYCQLQLLDVKTLEVRPFSEERWDTCYRIEWRPDGKGLVFIGTKLGDGSTIRRDQVYYVSLDGTARRLTTDSNRNQTESLGITDTNQVFSVPFSRSSQVWTISPDGKSSTATRLTNGSSDGRSGLVPLADGRIAFTARMGESHAAWVVDGDGSNRQQVVSDPPIIEELRATPDGKYFLFSALKDERSHLYRVDADGGNLKQVTSGDTYETDSSPSPDGKWIVFDSMPASNMEDRRLWKTSIEGGAPTKISDVKCAVPNFSPSGKYISCIWEHTIFVVSAEDGALVHTFAAVKIPLLNIGARWTPDERSLVYIVAQKSTTNLWVQPLDGKPATKLTDFPNGDVHNFAYSQDGSKLYLARGYPVRDAILIKNFQ